MPKLKKTCQICGHTARDQITDCDMPGLHGPIIDGECRPCREGRVALARARDERTQTLWKADELAILDETICRLGPQSYLGPWLAQVRDEAASAMRSDIRPEIRLAHSAQQCSEMLTQAARRTAETSKAAEGIVAAARKQADAIRAAVIERLRASLRELENY